jgi:hypothetical protein
MQIGSVPGEVRRGLSGALLAAIAPLFRQRECPILRRVKKRGKRWRWIAAAATVVALSSFALFAGSRTPYHFLRSAERSWIRVTPSPPSPPYRDLCEIEFVCDKPLQEVVDKAAKELEPLGWERIGNAFYTPENNAERIMLFTFEPLSWISISGNDTPPFGSTIIRLERIATPMDSLHAWLDRVTR